MVDYKEIATAARIKVLEMIHKAGTSHIGSNFSVVDIASVLYEKADLNKDKIIWSKGWAAATAYYFLSQKGIIPKEDLDTFCDGKSPYIGLLEPTIPGIECAGGSMGYGLPFGVGIALSKKMKKEEGNVYVIMSDGEQAIGTTWESALLASHHELDNLTILVDYNGFQAMGKTNEVLNIEPLVHKWTSFGWKVREINGHNFYEIEKALFSEGTIFEWAAYGEYHNRSVPRIIICHTTKGKGVIFMENLLDWHYKNVDESDYKRALTELNA